MRILNLLGVVLGILLVSFGAQAKLFDAQRFMLDNGLEVIVVPNPRAPIVKQMLVYKVGSVDESVGKGGSAHLLEHLMFRGTKKVKGQEFNRLMEENGAESNAFTSQNVTAYHQLLDISRLELAMYLEADRMRGLQIDENDFELERDIVFQERKQRIGNNPVAQFGEEVRRVLWQNNPYGQPIGGVEDEILNLTRADVEAFYQKHYAPEKAVLVLSGDVDIKTAQRLAQKYYGGLKKGKVKFEKNFPELKKIQSRVEMSLEQVQSPRLLKVFATPSYSMQSEEVYPLEVLAAYLGEGESSKLYKKLVREQKVALGVSVEYNPLSWSYGTFNLAAIPAFGVSVEELEIALAKAWEEALDELNLDELQKVKQKMLAGLIYLRDNPSDVAYVVGTMRAINVPLDEIENQADKIKAVTYPQVREVAQRLLNNAPQVTGVLRPKEVSHAQ